MEGSSEPVSLMMKGTGEGEVERTRIRRVIFFPSFIFSRQESDDFKDTWYSRVLFWVKRTLIVLHKCALLIRT